MPRMTSAEYATYQAHRAMMAERTRRRMSDAQKLRAANPLERQRRSADTKAWIKRNGHPKGFQGHQRTEEEKQKISDGAKRAWSDPKHQLNSKANRQRLSDHFSKIASARSAANSFSRTRKGFRKDLGLSFRSSWEANYARYLNWLMAQEGKILKWEYESETFWFEAIKRGCRSYKPDFKVSFIDGKVEHHEVKGWMYPRAKTALKRMKKYHPSVSLILIDQVRYKAIAKAVGKLIKGWE